MQEQPFRAWLRDVRKQVDGSIATRVADCSLVERHEGELDAHWHADGLRGLLDRLTYSREDERNGRSPEHNVPTKGDLYNNSATFKAAVNLYRKFLDARGDEGAEGSAANRERWDRYLEDVRRYVASDLLDSQEIEYKLAIERQLQEARRAVLEGDENCLALVTKAVNNNLTSTYDKIGLRNWFRDQPEEAQEALRAIWTDAEGLSVADRIRAFTRLIPDSLQSGTGTRLRWISVLLMACGARRFPPYKVTEFNKTYERTGHSGPAAGGDEASHYETALGFLDQLLERARGAGMERPKDRLEAQSVAWAVAYESPAPPNNGDQRPCWFVGASFGEGTEDQTARFVRESIWEHGGAKSDLFLDQVKLIEPGDRIAIKATYLKKRGLPFDNQGELTSTMAIKATGTVTRNPGDGRRLLVDWERVDPHREWYFFTFIPRVWKVSRETANLPWAADALIDFAFDGAEQDYDLFLRDWYPDRYERPVQPKHRLADADVTELASDLLYDAADLRTIASLLNDKRQVIFQGPPGTGKTYAARKLAHFLAGSDDRVTLVQFHPSYAYEDFVQGYRPALRDGQAGFTLRDGPLVTAAKKARAEPAAPHFLVIDEINRGNLAKVFGELYFLLEYRDEEMALQYAAEEDERFSLPENLYIIGTMNTADRSIALVDLALRRRFHFVEFHPDKPPVEGLLERWLQQEENDMEWLPEIVARANGKLNDRQAAIGPSYFMKRGLDEDKVRLIWEHNVLPYIEEHLYGESDRLAEFELDKLRGEPDADDAEAGTNHDNDAPTDDDQN